MSKKQEDYREPDQPKSKEDFSEPNNIDELLKDLEDYEGSFNNTDNVFQSPKEDRLIVEKHEPYENAKKIKKAQILDKQPKEQEEINKHRDLYDKNKFNDDLLEDFDEIDKLLENEEEYKKYLNIQE